MGRITYELALWLLRLSIRVDHRVAKGLIAEAFNQETRTREAHERVMSVLLADK